MNQRRITKNEEARLSKMFWGRPRSVFSLLFVVIVYKPLPAGAGGVLQRVEEVSGRDTRCSGAEVGWNARRSDVANRAA